MNNKLCLLETLITLFMTILIHDLHISNVFKHILALDDINFAWNIWKTEFLRICQHHAPIQKRKVRNQSKSWISKDVLSLIHQRDHAHKQAVKHNDNHDWLKYKSLRNLL